MVISQLDSDLAATKKNECWTMQSAQKFFIAVDVFTIS